MLYRKRVLSAVKAHRIVRASVVAILMWAGQTNQSVASFITVGTNDGGSNVFPYGSPQGGSNAVYQGDYQQLYSSSAFSGPVVINNIGFASTTPGGIQESETLTISLSTTSYGLNDLTANYNTNLGADNTQVYSGTKLFTGVENGSFDLSFATNSFTYNPANGNLLMTVDVTGSSGTTVQAFEATDDAVTSRVYNFGGSGAVTPEADYGLVTQFTVSPSVPEPASIACLIIPIAGGLLIRRRRQIV